MLNKLKAAVIGAGNIGAFLDRPDSQNVLTHAHAYKKHPGFDLVGFVDADIKKAQKAAKIWGGIASKTISEMAKKTKIDVVSVCVPDEKHYPVLREIEKLDILGGILEKPLTTDLKDSQKILNSGFFSEKNFLVNYTRRYVPEFLKLKQSILKGNYGKFVSGNGVYGKGLLHNGSHLIDLIRFLLGEIKQLEKLSVVYDFGKNDPTFSLRITMRAGGEILINAVDSRHFSVFELDMYFEKGRIKIADSGFEIKEYLLIEDKMFRGFKKVVLKRIIKTSMCRALYFTAENLYQMISKNKKAICTIEDGYKTQKICSPKE